MTDASAAADWTKSYERAAVLVLGGTGFVGRWMVRQLEAIGARVHVTIRDRGGWDRVSEEYGLDAVVHEVDATDLAALSALVGNLRPAVTFNLVGYGVDRSETDRELATRLNAMLPEHLVSILAEAPASWSGPRLVHAGSAAEYGAVSGDLAEETSARPVGVYGKTKWAGTVALQRAARDRGFPAVTARIFTVYGPGEHDGRLLPSLLNAARNPGVLPLTAGLQRRDFTYVEDVAEGLVRLGVAGAVGPGEIVNLCTGRLMSVHAFVDEAARILPIPADRLGFGLVPEREGEMAHEPVSVARCRERLQWVPAIPVGVGIKRTADFLDG